MEEACMQQTDATMPSWKDTATRKAIVQFVQTVTDPEGPGCVPPEERVAVFDNDGTLWCEKPMYIQLDFILRRLVAMAQADAALQTIQPWQAACTKDYAWLGGAITKHYQGDDSDVHVLLGGILKAFEGNTVEAFDAAAAAFQHTEQHPTLGRPYRACGYRPMVELLRYLEAHAFTTYIVSGGGRDFMRPVTQEMYGIPRDRVIGSAAALSYQDDEQGGTVIHQAALDFVDDGAQKPVRIWDRIGRRPILAVGNSNGDIEMLQYAGGPSRPALRLLLLHDDAEREFAYTAGAERALQLASARGWTVISMQNDWATVFDDAS
jgi:hypothetical protein